MANIVVEFRFDNKKIADEVVDIVNKYLAEKHGFKKVENVEAAPKKNLKKAPSMNVFKNKLAKLIEDLSSNIGKNTYSKKNALKNIDVLEKAMPWFFERKGANPRTQRMLASLAFELNGLLQRLHNTHCLRKADLAVLKVILKQIK